MCLVCGHGALCFPSGSKGWSFLQGVAESPGPLVAVASFVGVARR